MFSPGGAVVIAAASRKGDAGSSPARVFVKLQLGLDNSSNVVPKHCS
jgi:hypothetical protein